jgi:hypothetical protein
MRGGCYFRKNSRLSNIDRLANMLKNAQTKVNLLSDNSVYGFIYKLEMPKEVSEYSSSEFDFENTKITNYILKIVIIGSKADDDNILTETGYSYFTTEKDKITRSAATRYPEGGAGPDDNNIENKYLIQKEVMKMADFTKECEIQSLVYNRTSVKQNPICPAVCACDTFIITQNEQSANEISLNELVRTHFILSHLISPLDQQNDTMGEVHKSLVNGLEQPNRKIGFILMPLVENAVTLKEYFNEIENAPNNDKLYEDITLKIIINLFRLYFECGVYHMDLHSKNILISRVNNKVIPYFIDFGQIYVIDVSTVEKAQQQVKEYEEFTNLVSQMQISRQNKNAILMNMTMKKITSFLSKILNNIIDANDLKLDWILEYFKIEDDEDESAEQRKTKMIRFMSILSGFLSNFVPLSLENNRNIKRNYLQTFNPTEDLNAVFLREIEAGEANKRYKTGGKKSKRKSRKQRRKKTKRRKY